MDLIGNVKTYRHTFQLVQDPKILWGDCLSFTCKNLCYRHKAKKPIGSRYGIGQKRCNYCDTFMKWEGSYCPCCGSRLRLRPRNSKYKQKLMEQA